MKRLFVTGGHGFVGKWIQRLAPSIGARHGFEVIVPETSFDLLQADQVDAAIADARPDAVLHLAAQSNVPQAFKDPEGTLRVNLVGTLRLLEGLKRAGVAPRLVFASSGDVYGRMPADGSPVREEALPQPRNPYSVSKLAAEALVGQWFRTEGLQAIVARPFGHFGAGQADAFVLPSFARQIVEIRHGQRPPVIEVGDIDVERDFLHVADVIEAYLVLVDKGEPGETYNIASGVGRSIRGLLERMLALAGTNAEVRKDPARYRPAELRVVRGSNAKIGRLGWAPSWTIDAALEDILDDWDRRVRA